MPNIDPTASKARERESQAQRKLMADKSAGLNK
jgi:hypothetical protein